MRHAPACTGRAPYFLAALAVFLLDQASKVAADRWLRGREPLVVIPGCFQLSYSRNRGGLFGFFADFEDPWRFLLLTLFPIAAVVLIAWFLARTGEPDRSTLLGLGLILGGAAGNLLDRVLRGEVVDFLDVYVSWAPLRDGCLRYFGTAHWPTFNVADSAIVVGAGLLLLDVFRPERRRTPPAAEAGSG